MTRTVLFPFFVFLAIVSATYAQKDVTFEHIYFSEGLSQSSAQSVFADSRGLLWIGTQAGLNLFDGHDVTTFRASLVDSGSLSNDEVTAICEDRDGAIWVGTRDGLNRLHLKSGMFQRYLHSSAVQDSLGSSHIAAVLSTSDGGIWAGTRHGLVRRRSAEEWFRPISLGSASGKGANRWSISALCQDAYGHIWVGTGDRRLLELDTAGAILSTFKFSDVREQRSLVEGLHSFAVFEDSRHRLIVGEGESGVHCLDRDRSMLVPLNVELNEYLLSNGLLVTCISEDLCGCLWIGTYGGGLIRIQPSEDGHFEVFDSRSGRCGPPSDHYLSMARHESGMIMAGSIDRGLVTIRADKLSRLVSNCGEQPGLNGTVVTALYVDRSDILWVGFIDGLDRVDLAGGSVKTFRSLAGPEGSLPLRNIYYIGEDAQGNLMIGGYPLGLIRVDVERQTYRPLGQSRMVGSARLGPAGDLWVAALYEGAYRINIGEETVEQFHSGDIEGLDLSGRLVFEVLETPDGNAWLGTNTGLFRLNPGVRKGKAFFAGSPEAEGLLNHEILCLHYSARSGLWIGTSGGLHHYDADVSRFSAYTTENGLPSNIIYSCLEDEQGRLWLGTNNGLSRFDVSTMTFVNYGEADGLVSREFNQGPACHGNDGRLYFGTVDGVVLFYPDEASATAFDPPVLITSVMHAAETTRWIGGWPQEDVFRIGPDERDITFGFVGLDYGNPARLDYVYRLDGYDTQWREGGVSQTATYTNLPTGRYTFRARCRNAVGRWGKREATLGLVVLPSLWEHWWFRVALGIVIIGGISGLFLFRISEIKAQRDRLKAEVEVRTEELARLAATDSLTGVANRRHFIEHAAKELAHSHRFDRPFCFLMMDIDHFKRINDEYGHAVGDATLKTMVMVLDAAKRESDLLGRLGGDEFAVVLRETDGENGRQVAERLKQQAAASGVPTDGEDISFTVSVGVAARETAGDTLETLLKRADAALYRAKSAGRNRVEMS